MGLIDFLHRFFGEQPRKKIQFSFGYVLADIDPDAELGPAVLREYTIIKYRVPDIEVYGEVAVADFTKREMPLLWSNALARYGADAIASTDVKLADIGYVRVCRRAEGFGDLPDIRDTNAVLREFLLEKDVSVLPPKYTMSFLIRPQSGEVYREYYGGYYDDLIRGWSTGCRYLKYMCYGKERYVLSDWIPGYLRVSCEYILKVCEIINNRS